MKWFLISLLIGLPLYSNAQNAIDSLTPEQFNFEYDSISLSIWDLYFKENSEILPNGEEIRHEDKELARIQLSEKEGQQLLKQLKKKRSYDNERALQYHYDLVLLFYHDGEVAQRIEISMFTGNFTAENMYNEAYFRNSCSKALGKHIVSLLNEHGIIEQLELEEFHLTGLH